MHGPREPYMHALKRILRYVRGTLDYGLQLWPSSTTGLIAYSDVDWGDGHPLNGQAMDIVCFSVTIFYHGHLNDNRSCHVLVLKQNTEVLPMYSS